MKSPVSWTWGILAASAFAAAAQGQGTTVQLPTYRTFQSGGAVVVPDRGSALLGGVSRARSSRSEWGAPIRPFGNRAIGSDLSTARTSVSVYIHDFAAMEEELERAAAGSPRPKDLAKAPARPRPAPSDFAAEPPPGPAEAPLASLEEIRRQRRLDAEARDAEARDFLARGAAAEASGKLNVARIYYQIAARRASAALRDEILARLDALRRQQAEIARHEP